MNVKTELKMRQIYEAEKLEFPLSTLDMATHLDQTIQVDHQQQQQCQHSWFLLQQHYHALYGSTATTTTASSSPNTSRASGSTARLQTPRKAKFTLPQLREEITSERTEYTIKTILVNWISDREVAHQS
jgi:hypothetical protein